MNLADVLMFSGMNRNTFNSLERRLRSPNGHGGLEFMRERLTPGDGHDRYKLAHAVALRCFIELRDAGVPPGHAATVISATFDYIADQVEDAAERPERLSDEKLIRYFPDPDGHYGWSAGSPSSTASLGGGQHGSIHIDLNQVTKRIWDAASQWLGIKVG